MQTYHESYYDIEQIDNTGEIMTKEAHLLRALQENREQAPSILKHSLTFTFDL